MPNWNKGALPNPAGVRAAGVRLAPKAKVVAEVVGAGLVAAG